MSSYVMTPIAHLCFTATMKLGMFGGTCNIQSSFENDWIVTSLPKMLLVASLARANEHWDGEELGSAMIASNFRRASALALA